jgi:hypothetical protein
MATKRRSRKRSLRGFSERSEISRGERAKSGWVVSGNRHRRDLGPCKLLVSQGKKFAKSAQWMVTCHDKIIEKGTKTFAEQAREAADTAAMKWIRSDAKKYAS